MSGGSGDIIIKGGSVELRFDESLYPKTADPIVYRNADRKITRVVITGEITFDSGEHTEGLRCEVKATTAPTAGK
ncbi:MAG TPA: hypothetical protein VMS31_08660 [Pyrinomonadaceae bacterium]|nr:hypothetical protein [Pyrinomonadaceae bacterium]